MNKKELRSGIASVLGFAFKAIGTIMKFVFIGFIMLWKAVGNAVKDAF